MGEITGTRERISGLLGKLNSINYPLSLDQYHPVLRDVYPTQLFYIQLAITCSRLEILMSSMFLDHWEAGWKVDVHSF